MRDRPPTLSEVILPRPAIVLALLAAAACALRPARQRGAARVMGMDDELGSIEPGKLADLILVDGDPTTDISDIGRVVTVIRDGRVYDPAAIYRALGIEPCCEAEVPPLDDRRREDSRTPAEAKR